MIKRNNKKGFTIVELVIVIAVIAILAAVLIPTFAGIIKKANISKDTQLAKNLNTILISEEAEGNKPADFSEVLSVLRENGYVVENLNPTTEGYYFVWESTTNQILLVDENFKLSYSSKDLEDAVAVVGGGTWYFAVKDAALVEAIKAQNGKVVPAVDTAWVGNDGQKVVDLLNKGGVVTLNESIALSTAPKHPTNADRADGIRIKDGQEVTLNLAGQTLSADFETYNYRMFQVFNGTFNLTDGNIVATAKLKDNGGLSLYGVVNIGGNGTEVPVANISNVTLTYTGAETLDTDDGGSVIMINDAKGVLTLKDSTIVATTAVGVYCDKGNATLENVTIKSTGEFAHVTTCVAVGHGGTMNIKSGTYSAQDAVIYVYPSGGTVNISGGVFTGKIKIGTQDDNVGDSIINITGGTFNGSAFNSLTEAQWREFLVNDQKGEIEVINAGTNNVTIKVAAAK
jgi:type IV pilus assembly protein PilA